MTERRLGVSDFKARCLGLLDELDSKGEVLVITKHGRPIAKVTPISKTKKSTRDRWKGIAKTKGNIVHVNEAKLWENA